MAALEPVSEEVIRQTIDLMSQAVLAGENVDVRVREAFPDEITANRLLNFIREAFGIALVTHLRKGKVNFLPYFQVKDRNDNWKSIPWSSEPIFPITLRLAMEIFHTGPRDKFEAISFLSATVKSADEVLKNGCTLEGVTSSIYLFDVPAEIYPEPKKNIWEKFFAWRLAKRKAALPK